MDNITTQCQNANPYPNSNPNRPTSWGEIVAIVFLILIVTNLLLCLAWWKKSSPEKNLKVIENVNDLGVVMFHTSPLGDPSPEETPHPPIQKGLNRRPSWSLLMWIKIQSNCWLTGKKNTPESTRRETSAKWCRKHHLLDNHKATTFISSMVLLLSQCSIFLHKPQRIKLVVQLMFLPSFHLLQITCRLW